MGLYSRNDLLYCSQQGKDSIWHPSANILISDNLLLPFHLYSQKVQFYLYHLVKTWSMPLTEIKLNFARHKLLLGVRRRRKRKRRRIPSLSRSTWPPTFTFEEAFKTKTFLKWAFASICFIVLLHLLHSSYCILYLIVSYCVCKPSWPGPKPQTGYTANKINK